MLRQISVIDPGDTTFLIGEHVEKWRFEEANKKLIEQGGKAATAEPLLLGITKASLSTDSFISAASFQGSEGKRNHGPSDSGWHRHKALQGRGNRCEQLIFSDLSEKILTKRSPGRIKSGFCDFENLRKTVANHIRYFVESIV